MKLGKLNAAIDAAPTIFIRTHRLGPIALQKGSMKEALKRTFTEGRSQETGLALDPEGAFINDTNQDLEPEAGDHTHHDLSSEGRPHPAHPDAGRP